MGASDLVGGGITASLDERNPRRPGSHESRATAQPARLAPTKSMPAIDTRLVSGCLASLPSEASRYSVPAFPTQPGLTGVS
jgi:hypothetical protein